MRWQKQQPESLLQPISSTLSSFHDGSCGATMAPVTVPHETLITRLFVGRGTWEISKTPSCEQNLFSREINVPESYHVMFEIIRIHQ